MPDALEDRRKVVQLIETMICIDGVVTEEERQFLRRMIERYGLYGEDRSDQPVPSDPAAQRGPCASSRTS